MSESTDVQAGDVVTGAVVDRSEVTGRPTEYRSEFDKFLLTSQEQDGDGPAVDPFERIIAQVLSAETPDAVLTPVEAVQGRDLVGVNLLFHGFELNKSEYDVGSPFYLSMQCERADTGDPLVVNCGHKKVIAQAVKLKEFGQWPYQVMFMERGHSKIGGTPMLELRKWVTVEPPPF